MTDLTVEIAELNRAARRYSVSGELELSVPIWQKLAVLAPEQWGHVLDLVHDLRRAGKSSEADEIHRRAVNRFPREFWVVYHWALSAWNEHDYTTAETRSVPLLGLLQQLPQADRTELDKHACWLLGSLAMKRRAFEEAVSYFERACRSSPEDPHLADLLRRARHYGRVVASFGSQPLLSDTFRTAADYAVLVINLDRDVERFQRLCNRFRDSPVELVRVPGVYGSYLPRIALQDLCHTTCTPPAGEAGCLLTHVKAWETIVTCGLGVCLILEDDAMPMVNLPHRFASLGIPLDFELCFVNKKMEPRVSESVAASVSTTAVFHPLEVLATFHSSFNSPGTDGYFISDVGARKLLAYFERDGFGGAVDWRLIGYSLCRGAKDRWPTGSEAHAQLNEMENLPGERLRTFALFPCLIEADTSYINTRVTENERGLQ